MTIAYQYTASGNYAGAVEDYGVLPNNATYIAPPAQMDGHVLRWTGGEWTQIENHKGKSGYVDGQPTTITDYGPLPNGWSDTPPPPSLVDVKAAKRQAIIAGLDAAMTASLTMPSASTPPSAYAVAQAMLDWRTDDPEGYAELLAIHTARRDDLLAAVDAAQTVDAVQAIIVGYAV